MNILVIGLGSMGKRRIRLIKEMYPDDNVYGVDEREDRCVEAKNILGIEYANSIDDAALQFNIDAAFVCTSPLSHNLIINKCLKNRWNVFTEINLVSEGYQENMKLAEKNDCILFLSSTFLYREETRYIRNYIDDKCKWNYVYHIGQYLPDWHPWEDYKAFFVEDKRSNGCREIMAIELPWIIQSFGEIESFQVTSDKMSGLEINYNDNYMIQFVHKNGNKGVLVIDVVSPVAVRRIEIYAENRYLCWGGTPDALYEYEKTSDQLKQVILSEKEEHKEGYREFVTENAYKNEIKEFMDVVMKRKEQLYGFKEDMQVLQLIDLLEAKNE